MKNRKALKEIRGRFFLNQREKKISKWEKITNIKQKIQHTITADPDEEH